jgi:hypothetical protein
MMVQPILVKKYSTSSTFPNACCHVPEFCSAEWEWAMEASPLETISSVGGCFSVTALPFSTSHVP